MAPPSDYKRNLGFCYDLVVKHTVYFPTLFIGLRYTEYGLCSISTALHYIA